MDFYRILKTSFFMFEKHSFLFIMVRNNFFWLILEKKNGKWLFLDKFHRLILLGNCHYVYFFKTSLFLSRKHSTQLNFNLWNLTHFIYLKVKKGTSLTFLAPVSRWKFSTRIPIYFFQGFVESRSPGWKKEKRLKHFILGDCFIKSPNLFSLSCMKNVRRKLI